MARSLLVLLACALLGAGFAGCGGGRAAGGFTARVAPRASAPAQAATITTSSIPQGQAVRGDSDADNPSDIDGNGDNDLKTTSADRYTSDGDNDNPTPESYRYPDRDDKATLAYGRAPSQAERLKIVSVLTRYYAAAVKADGSTACALLFPPVAKAVPEDYGSGAGPAYLRGGKTCAAVLTRLFAHDRAELTPAPKPLSVRVKGAAAEAVLASRAMPASLLYLRHQGGSWFLQGLLAAPLP
jgi:hypothetical protein